MATIRITEAAYGSALQTASVALRDRVLRQPLGLQFTDEQLLAEQGQIHLVAVDGEQVVGCILLVPQEGGVVKFRQMAVDAAYQQQGVGRLLVQQAEALAKAKQFRRATLHARQVAAGFYEKLGYVAVGEPFIEVTIPHIAMEKPLG